MFRFKQFNVDQSGCAMKINTDGVLLGALADVDRPVTILDIGTGTGVIALMLAQRFEQAHLDAVEIDETAAATAKRNFAGSRYADRLSLHAGSFETFLGQNPVKKYDLIVSNPPFYINSLESPETKKNLAKHSDEIFFENLVKSAAVHLKSDGAFWLILPLQSAQLVKDISFKFGLNIRRIINVLSYPDSLPHREILVLALDGIGQLNDEFVIYTQPKVYSKQYEDLLQPFFTIFK